MDIKRICPQCKSKRSWPANRSICSGCRTFNARVKRGEILSPTYTETSTEGYKKPMQPVEKGFGYIGAITQSKDGEKIQCHICGYFFANLGAHVRMMHEQTAREYKYKFGLRITQGLVSPVERMKMQNRYNDKARAAASKGIASIRKKWADEPWDTGGDVWSSQTRNEKGMCRAQTLAKIKHLAELNDGIALWNDFVRMYGTGQRNVVAHWFGTWDKAVAEAGLTTYDGRRKSLIEGKKKDVVQKIADFYELHGRTPQSSDFNSMNEFPSATNISKMFGSLNAARREAGVPELIHISGSRWEERPV